MTCFFAQCQIVSFFLKKSRTCKLSVKATKQHQELFLFIYKSKMLTSSAVVSEEHVNTSSELGRDCEVSCMYKDSTVPRMSSAMGMSNNNKLTLKSKSKGAGLKLRMY